MQAPPVRTRASVFLLLAATYGNSITRYCFSFQAAEACDCIFDIRQAAEKVQLHNFSGTDENYKNVTCDLRVFLVWEGSECLRGRPFAEKHGRATAAWFESFARIEALWSGYCWGAR